MRFVPVYILGISDKVGLRPYTFFEPQRAFVSQTNHGERGSSRKNHGGPQDGASIALVVTWSATFGPPTAPEPTLLSKIISRLRGNPNVVRADSLYPWVYGVCGTGESWARIAD